MNGAPPGDDVLLVAVDGGSPGPREAEHLLHAVLGPAPGVGPAGSVQTAATHLVGTGHTRHHAVTLTARGDARTLAADVLASDALAPAGTAAAAVVLDASGAVVLEATTDEAPPALLAGAREAAQQAQARAVGRLVRFPGQEHLVGRLGAEEVVARSAVDAVVGLAGVRVGPGAVVDTLGWVRPTYDDGQVVLLVQPAAGGVLIPFEVERQVACCALH